MRRFHLPRGLIALTFGLLLSLGVQAAEQTLLVAAGAGYKRPVGELCSAFERAQHIKVEQIYGNMAQVLSQARESGKVAMVMGDQSFLQRAKDIRFDHYAPLGQGRLVLAWPTGQHLAKPADLLDARFARIAMPDPKNAIYGRAATEFMATEGWTAQLQPRLMVVATVPQVSAYLVSGNVDAGFLNLTDVLGIKDRIGGYIELDTNAYQPIRIVGAVLDGQQDKPDVKALESFMASPEARAIMERYGL